MSATDVIQQKPIWKMGAVALPTISVECDPSIRQDVWMKNRVCHIGKLIVHPDFQNKGIGRELMTEIERLFPHCHKFSLYR